MSTALFGLKPSTSEASPNSQFVIYLLLRIINHRIVKDLSFCVLACLVFSPKINAGFNFARPIRLTDCRLSSMCRFEKVVGNRMFRKLSDALVNDRTL